MIKTWAANITPLFNKDCYDRYYQSAPEFRQKKADRLKNMQGKAQSIGVWALYEEMKRFLDVSESAVYNFSHSGEYVICAVSVDSGMPDAGQIRVGCDVEKVKAARMELAKRFFCESEYNFIAAEENEKLQRELFYRYWVLKESFMKATRKGMEMALDAFEICLGSPSVLLQKPEEFSEPFYYMESELGDGTYRVAVCSTDAYIDSEVKEIKLGL